MGSILIVVVLLTLSGTPAVSASSNHSYIKTMMTREKGTMETYKIPTSTDPEVNMNAAELITSKGFPYESYYVTTMDGYILNLVRIPHGRKKSNFTGSKPVVVLMHGLMGSCTNYLTNPVNESLAYILADAGADVWMGNNRGNAYSANHTKLDPRTPEFWKFSFDEMARYDLPATINFILAKSGVDQVYYVGHSQGTTIGLIQFGEDKELASHIKHFFAMAPVAQVGHTRSPIRRIAPFADELLTFFRIFGHAEFGVEPEFLKIIAEDICIGRQALMCANLLFFGCGFDYSSFNMSRIPVYVAHNPSGTSVNAILHWCQAINSKKFQAFDYGSWDQNLQHYGQKKPPHYHPEKMKVPVAIFRGGKDRLAAPRDVEWLLPQLNVTHDINIEHYEHLDFIWAFDSPSVVYKTILEIIFG